MMNLFKSLRSVSLRRTFATQNFQNYYTILGVETEASPEEIKQAYARLAQKYNPILFKQGSSLSQEEASARFQEVTEAYTVLSSEADRLQYDIDNQANPQILREKINRVAKARDATGNSEGDLYDVNDYGRRYRQFLTQERKSFNVGNYETYTGGLPVSEAGRVRGGAKDIPGRFHNPEMHNETFNPFPLEQIVDQKRTFEFENLKSMERELVTRRSTWLRAKVETDFFDFTNQQFFFNSLRGVILFFLLVIITTERRNFALRNTYENLKEDAAQEGLTVRRGVVHNSGSTYRIHDNGVVMKLN